MSVFSNPWVLGGAALVGLLVLTSRSSGNIGSPNVVLVDAPRAQPSKIEYSKRPMIDFSSDAIVTGKLIDSVTAQNIAGGQASVMRAQINSDTVLSAQRLNIQHSISLMDRINNAAQISAVQNVKMADINAGVTKARIFAYTSQFTEILGNQTRQYLARLDYGKTIDTNRTQRAIAKTNANASNFQSVVGNATNLATFGLKAAFGGA